MSDMDGIIREFLVESYENLEQLDRDLVALEKNPGDKQRLASVFRTIHTIKGTCGFFGFDRLGTVTHVGENLLTLLRDGTLDLDAERTSALLALVDAVRKMLADIEAHGKEGAADFSELLATLTRLQEPSGTIPRAAAPAAPEPEVRAADSPPPPEPSPMPVEAGPPPAPALEAVRPHAEPEGAAAEAHRHEEHAHEHRPTEGGEASGGGLADTTIRVDVSLLDKLMNLVGELVLARNQVLKFSGSQRDTAFIGTSQRLNLITTELQENVMKTRMQPIGNVCNKFPRVVRDLALLCGKQVRLTIEGKETELDKTIIEAIKDPLTHIIRNSVDHGIETPEVRLARGKSPEGHLTVRAFHEGGQVNIEITDDGGGINGDKVKKKALERGLLTPDRAAQLSDRDLVSLIFLPGFSTAEKVTSVSGRGVGMDVVKTNIERIGGTIDVQSRLGEGTTMKIKIPLTLAIIPALVVVCGGERFAIPQVSLVELVRLEGGQARKGVERMHGAPVYRLRGRLLPLVFLSNELRIEPRAAGDILNIVVLQADERQFGLVVDGVLDTEEIVVKPLGKQLKGLPQFAGTTIMGDGRVALILDVVGLAHGSGVLSRSRESGRSAGEVRSGDRTGEVQSLLLFTLGESRRLAIPLAQVSRLEEIPLERVEVADNQQVVQYRGQIMPLISMANVLGGCVEPSAVMQVVVYSYQGCNVGLVVGRILDVAESDVVLERNDRRPGVLGSAIIQGKVTDFVDLPGVIRSADPVLFGQLTGTA